MRAAMHLALACAVFMGTSTRADTPSSRCLAGCQRHVKGMKIQAPVCGRCLFSGGDASSWMERLAAVPPSVLEDPDWLVRWAGLRSQAKRAGQSPAARLASWTRAKDVTARNLACVTAAYVAGERKEPLARLLPRDSPCLATVAEWQAPMSSQLYALDTAQRLEALTHLSAALGVTTGRLVLDAVATRPEASDEVAAALLVTHAENGGAPAGYALLSAARPGDEAAMNRLLSHYALIRDTQRPHLTATDKTVRKLAVNALATIAPLSQAELTTALKDESSAVRAGAARGLAAGEGRTVLEATRARLASGTTTPLGEQLLWLAVLADTSPADCASVLRPTWRDVARPTALRTGALVALAACLGTPALPDVEQAFADPNLNATPGPSLALARLPRSARALKLVDTALAGARGEVLAAAIEATAAHRASQRASDVAAWATSGQPVERRAAVQALSVLDAPKARQVASRGLLGDPDADMRRQCARVLGELGGPPAAAALTRASRDEVDPSVKFVVDQSLRKLGL